ncbi:hypothetical protein [Nocardiopsis lucentensis]|uniref:hypothetical protein n=1 Tax=Nocardiopsis lucentensis TaxID=53441 RepID=UPI000347F841|nr:hypothetical protein [Nocardiopsis lucentensis]
MNPVPHPVPGEVVRFVDLSVHLTGFPVFDLHATGMAEMYLDTARQQVGRSRFDEFLKALRKACAPRLGPAKLEPTDREIARAVTYLWYTGAWPRLAVAAHADLRREMANREFVVTPSAYTEGLVWSTFHGHPAGAKPPGYGTWSIEPAAPPSLAEIERECGLERKDATDHPTEEHRQDERADEAAFAAHRLPGPRVARDVPPSAVPTARAQEPEGNPA